jgi:hypothetical protein
MANCPPIRSGVVDFVYDEMPDGNAVAFDHYRLSGYQYAVLRAEMAELVDVLDPKEPPWIHDKTRSPAVFKRKIQYYGTIWYTFALIAGQRQLVILTGTCEGADDQNAGVRSARQQYAEQRVEQLRLEGYLCE